MLENLAFSIADTASLQRSRACKTSYVAVIALSLGASSCASTVDLADNNTTVQHHLGYVRVIKPQNPIGMESLKTSTFGAAFFNGVRLGWSDQNNIFVEPGECRVLIFVKNTEELNNAAAILSKVGSEDLCFEEF
ncbi:MAG: hypothetical protein GKS03_11050 [Alphaproteobacteria bacterium]|nr:hypothetical protein [Alphaproteobacteria bacterium]